MTKWEKVEAMSNLIERKYGSQAAVAGYFKGMATSYIDEKDLDFHLNRMTAELQKECAI